MYRSERGAVIVVVAVMLVTIMAAVAIVVDVGQIFLTKKRLQNAADASALAGCFVLVNKDDPVLADLESHKYVSANIAGEVQYSSVADPSKNSFQVNLSQKVDHFFAPVIGFKSSKVSVSATAGGNTVISITGIVPLGVVQQQFEFNKPYTLKYGGGDGVNGSYGALALGGSGASNYRSNLMYGYKEEIKLGDIVKTETGNMAGPTSQGVNYRISLDHSDISNLAPNSPRVVIVPVIDRMVGDGSNATATVVGFAAFYLESTDGKGEISGSFLKWAVSGKVGTGPSFGVVSPTLIQ